jgi:hypothetical protein
VGFWGWLIIDQAGASVGRGSGQQAQRAAGWLQSAVEQNPLVVALAAIGAMIGLSSKPTQLQQHAL